MSVAPRLLFAAAGALASLLALAAPPLTLPAPLAPLAPASAPAVPSTPLRALPALPALKPNPELAPVSRPPLLLAPGTSAGVTGAAPQPAGNPASPGPVYVLIQAARQGRLKGEVATKGLENASEVWQLKQGIGPSNGQPLVFRHALGAMAVQLQQALVSNEKLSEVLFHSFAPDAVGRTLPVLNLRLLNATVIDVREVSGDTPGAPSMQEVALMYQRLEVTDVGSGLVAVEDRANAAR
jgi:type VI protein secretion system component Hcp